MVKNLAEKGYDVTIFDLSPAAIEAVQATSPNVKVASTPALAAVKADAVITMLPGPAVVQVQPAHEQPDCSHEQPDCSHEHLIASDLIVVVAGCLSWR